MSNLFNFSQRDVEGGSAFLDEPYIGKANLKEIDILDRPGRKEGETYDSISVTFTLHDAPKKGMEFRYNEYGPDAAIPSEAQVTANPNLQVELGPQLLSGADALKKVASTYKRVIHLLHPWIPYDELMALAAQHAPTDISPTEAWKNFREAIAERWKTVSNPESVEATIKVIPNYNRTKLTFQPYPGFIAVNEPLTFSPDDRAAIREFKNLQNAEPSDMGGDGAPAETTTRATF